MPVRGTRRTRARCSSNWAEPPVRASGWNWTTYDFTDGGLYMVDRRSFLAAAAAAAMGSVEAAPQLAVNSGTPVRSKPLGGPNWGPQYYDGKEQRQLEEVLESRNPFRFANPLDRSKVDRKSTRLNSSHRCISYAV